MQISRHCTVTLLEITRTIASANEELAGKSGGSAMKLQIVRVLTSVKEKTVYVKVNRSNKTY